MWNGSQTGYVEGMTKQVSSVPTLHCVVFLASGVRAQGCVSNKRHEFALPFDQSPAPKPGIQGSPDLAIAFRLSFLLNIMSMKGLRHHSAPPKCACPRVPHPILCTPTLLLDVPFLECLPTKVILGRNAYPSYFHRGRSNKERK